MNFKRFHESKNLFDKDNTTIYNAYFNTAGYWLLSSDSKSVKIPCQPNTEYTLSVPNSLAVFRIFENDNANIEPTSTETASSKTTTITRNENISQYTFTTSSTAQIILFQGSNGALTEWFNGLMLNSGSTALPYEPYSSEVWHDIPHYIHNTSTDTLTTLPAVIYPTDTTATVGLKGQTTQSSIPSPTSPVMPEGTGERTGNWFDSTIYELVPVSTTAQRKGINLGVLPQGTYTLNAVTSSPTQIYRTTKNGDTYTYETILTLPYTFTTDGVSEQIIRTAGQSGNSWADVGYTKIMLNLGSTALPYEPYGYFIEIEVS